jgi:hypothetical protein
VNKRVAAAVFFSAVIIVVLALIVYTEQNNASQTVDVWILIRDVAAGSVYSSADVQQVQIHAASGDFNYEARSPSQLAARYTRGLKSRDVVRTDDLVPTSAQSEIAITIQNPPPLNPGDVIDVFAALPTGQQALIGHDVTVATVSGGSLTLVVPVSDEASWVAVGSSNTSLHAARTVPGAQLAPSPLSADDAIHILCGAACADTFPKPSATP